MNWRMKIRERKRQQRTSRDTSDRAAAQAEEHAKISERQRNESYREHVIERRPGRGDWLA